jgi:23S rRNA (adenine1618-N6)-methyltransferase
MRPKWKFYGTEIDELNTTWARKNITLNDMASRIQVQQNTASGNILLLDAMGIEYADFVMCNPPFYKSKEDMQRSLTKDTPPSAVCTGADVEMITDGGDAGFAVRIVEESKVLGERVQWYTCMLGKLSSLTVVVEKIKELSCQNWAIGCLVPGNKTRRWVVGWSWGNLRPTNVSIRFNELPSLPILK